jgi:DNA-binding winged helix-turn-helix (wHTH) protein
MHLPKNLARSPFGARRALVGVMQTQRRIYEFDDFRVDTGQFILTRRGQARPVSPTAFRILLTLLERAGQSITKEELMKYVWPDCYVEEGNLNRNVSTLRKVLDEKPSDHRYIETIPKIGYRFVAPVRVLDYQRPAGPLRKPLSRTAQPFVGRHEQRAALRQAFEQARQGQGRLVCISADVGLGKTALVEAFVHELHCDGETFHFAQGRSSESFTESEPFLPWIESLGILAEESAIAAIMQKTAPNWYEEIAHIGSGNPQKMKRELLDFCRQVSAVHPLILVIEDFHWADISSVDLLAFLATRLESIRVLVIACYRPAEMNIQNHPFLRLRSDLLSRGTCTEIRLGPLTPADIDDYLAMERVNGEFSADSATLLYGKSEGHPLFLRELLRSPDRTNDSIRHVIQAKLDRLDDTHRQLLVTASVQGREFDTAVLAATMQINAQDVEEALHELDQIHGLVERIREEELPDGRFRVRYRFVYGVYQEACYASLAPTRKASVSASLAEAFLTYYGH